MLTTTLSDAVAALVVEARGHEGTALDERLERLPVATALAVGRFLAERREAAGHSQLRARPKRRACERLAISRQRRRGIALPQRHIAAHHPDRDPLAELRDQPLGQRRGLGVAPQCAIGA